MSDPVYISVCSIRCLMTVIALIAICPLAAYANTRSLEHDGVNASWIYLHLIGQRGMPTIEDFAVGSSRQLSLLDVAELLNTHGTHVAVASLTFRELCLVSTPAIVLLRHAEDGTGQLAILISCKPGFVSVLRAGTVEVEQLNEDDFRRVWSGHAIIAQAHNGFVRLVFFAALGAIPTLWCIKRATFSEKSEKSDAAESIVSRV